MMRDTAREAVVYGLPAALQYLNLHRTVLVSGAGQGFDTWHHDRDLATPDYAGFRTPNVDTLYSTAWLNLSGGPLEIDVPVMGTRYYTVTLLDAHSNAVNLSTRTLGPDGGRVWLVPPAWEGDVPTGVLALRVSTPYLWALMRIFVRSDSDVAEVRRFQDRIVWRRPPTVESVSGADGAPWPEMPDDDEKIDGATVLRALDAVLRRNGHPLQEEALLARFRMLGVGGPEPLRVADWSPEVREAVEEGYADAMELVRSVIGLRGRPAGDSGWRTLASGAYGYNYLHRAATNYVGLGGTTREESGPYTALVDGEGVRLDGSRSSYRLNFSPPPVDAFWSLTVYDLAQRQLVPNAWDRHVLNSLTEDLQWTPEGTLPVHLGVEPGPARTNWLPTPAEPFYVVLRAYLGHPEVVDGSWVPEPVVPCSMEPGR